MGQLDRGVRILVIDPHMELGLSSSSEVFDRIDGLPEEDLAGVREQLAQYDIIVEGVDCSLGLQLGADLCAQPSTPPVMAICGRGFDGKSPEHILLQAELRGAVATLPKPLEAVDILLAAMSLPHGSKGGRSSAFHPERADPVTDEHGLARRISGD